MTESSPRPIRSSHRFSVPGFSAWVAAAGLCALVSLAPGLHAQEPAAQDPETQPSGPPVPNAAADPGDEDLCAELRSRAAGEPAAALDGFEAKLKEHPDDLRCGNGYRRAVIAAEAYERAVDFFKALVEAHPQASNAFLNLGYALVDKIPTEGAITQVLLANEALGHFSKALELEETWVGLYTRGNSYLFWPPIFGRTPLGMADLERAVAMSKKMEKREHHARAWAAMGDGHWRLDDLEQARATWQQGAKLFPGNPHLEARLDKSDEDLAAFLDGHFDANNRVDTDLEVLWEGGP